MSGRLGRLPLFWKLLVPFAVLILVVGALGVFLVVHDLTSRARASLNQDLQQASLDARGDLQGHELDLLDAASLAANLQGMAGLIDRRDAEAVASLLRGVVALKSDLDLVSVASLDGNGLVEFGRDASGAMAKRSERSWLDADVARAALTQNGPDKHGGLIADGDESLVAIASPVCSKAEPCTSAGIVVLGLRAHRVVAEPGGRTGSRRFGMAIYDVDGRLLALSGLLPGTNTTARPTADALRRRTATAGDDVVHVLYAPFEMAERSVGIMAVALPDDPAFTSVRGVAWRLTFIVFAVLLGIMAVGALVSRRILRQVRSLVATNRALASGDLSARVDVMSQDEIGEVALGLNQMAAQLQASHETLESRVTQRTEEVQRLLAERTEFFASLSHELRTPLAITLNEADALLETGTSRQATSVRAIKLSGVQLLSTVNEILDLAKAEVGRLDIRPLPLRLHEAIAELRPTIEGLARTGSIRLAIRIAADLPAVNADRQRLREIVLNLIDNAVKYAPPGGSVSISAVADADAVRIDVSDTGPAYRPGSAIASSSRSSVSRGLEFRASGHRAASAWP